MSGGHLRHQTSPAEAITAAVRGVTKTWAKQRKAEERDRNAASNRRRMLIRSVRVTLREAAFEVMEDAWREASSGGTLPVKPRQIMYRARPHILARTGQDSLDGQYFSQVLLISYMEEHDCSDWDVIWDARGHLIEPHTGIEIPLGTLEVRQYLGQRPSFGAEHQVSLLFPTAGPENRYGNLLYIEKEGFHPIFQAARLAERFDLALLSNKGMSVTAARMLIDQLADQYDKVFVLRDFDRAGFSIFGTLATDSRRYMFENDLRHKVVDLGLRLTDIKGLQSEPVPLVNSGEWQWRAITLRRHGATEEEIEFLRNRRVELNAMTSGELVDFVEGKLIEHGVGKVIPADDIIEQCARRAIKERLQADLADELTAKADAAKLPKNLRGKVEALLEENPELPWDAAVAQIISK